MTTKDIVEAILYLNPDTEKLFRASHIISEERNWKAKPHPEYPFINAFKDPRFLVIISTQIHVYLIGDTVKAKGRGSVYNILNLEGFTANHYTLGKTDLTKEIKKSLNEPLYLPHNTMDRIIYMYKEELFIFNRLEMKNTNKYKFFGKWLVTMGTNIYDASNKTYITTADEILKNIYSEF